MPPCPLHPRLHDIHTPNFLIAIILGRGIMILLRLSQGIPSGCHHTTSTTNLFLNCHYWAKWALCFCFDLAKVFLQSATTPPLHICFGIVITVGKGALSLCFDLAKVFPQVATMPALHHLFGIFVIMGRGTLCFCFDLAKVFLQGATMPPLHPFF